MEHFSIAYVSALAVANGFIVKEEPKPDNDSNDIRIVGHGALGGKGWSPNLWVQLKCTTNKPKDGVLTHRIKLKNYDDLRRTIGNLHRILVVVHVPDNWPDRVRWSLEELRLSHCAYWIDLYGFPEAKSKSTSKDAKVTVKLDKVLDMATLNDLMHKVAAGTFR